MIYRRKCLVKARTVHFLMTIRTGLVTKTRAARTNCVRHN